MPASPLHVAGFPLEELLGAALISVVPVLALLGLEIRDLWRRIVNRLPHRKA